MKTAIITGASSGMGREMVFLLADRFSGLEEIWVIARRRDRLEELLGQVPVRLQLFVLDLTEAGAREAFREALEEKKPQVKFLVNAAGAGTPGLLEEIPPEKLTEEVRLNCEALTWMTRTVFPYMDRNSRILQFASASAFMPQPGFAVYAATKAYVLSFSRALAAEGRARGIYVTAVCPGPVRTEFFSHMEDGRSMASYKRFFMARPERVVKKAPRDSMMGKEVSVYGFWMKGFWLLCRILPHSLLAAAAMKLSGKNGNA